LNIHLHCLVLDGVWRAGSQIGEALRQHSRWALKVCRSEALFSRARVLEPARPTELTEAFTGRLARGIRNRLMNEFRHVNSPPLPFPVQYALTQTVATPASAQGTLELMTIWAGQNARLYHSTDAIEFITQLIAEAETVFSKYWEAVSAVRNSRSIPATSPDKPQQPDCEPAVFRIGVRACYNSSALIYIYREFGTLSRGALMPKSKADKLRNLATKKSSVQVEPTQPKAILPPAT
jgi:hypothetical protein